MKRAKYQSREMMIQALIAKGLPISFEHLSDFHYLNYPQYSLNLDNSEKPGCFKKRNINSNDCQKNFKH